MFSAAIAFDQAGADYIEVVSGIAILRVDREGKVNTNAPSTPAASSMPRVSISSRSDKISATAHFFLSTKGLLHAGLSICFLYSFCL